VIWETNRIWVQAMPVGVRVLTLSAPLSRLLAHKNGVQLGIRSITPKVFANSSPELERSDNPGITPPNKM